MAPYMPHELEELILHHLRNDNTALRETSLACYRFAIVSQKLLFSSIRIDLTLGRSPEVFPNFLKAAPHIANVVRGIDVVADSYRLQTLDTSLIPCLSLVANLQHLSIDTNSTRPIYWRYLSPVMRSSLCDIARSNRLVTLRLRRVFEIPLSLIAECSNLEALSLCSIAFQQDDIQRILNGGWSLCPSTAAPKLRTLQLSISDEAFRVLLNFLIGSNALFDISTLTELSISIFNPRFDYANVNLILQAVGGSLEIFCFSPMIADSPGVHSRGERFSALRLHPLPRLRIFRLRLVADSAYKIKTTYSLFKNCASKILSQFGSDHRVEEISVKTSISLELKGDAFGSHPAEDDFDYLPERP
ncbi:hypothetical protein BDN70DRAFT_889572 [Pholiota conissans]|uniref:F-box domain-containing protein n=1 Tax=Pholiota conissans TaxID=109636 RepID=A0A9P6D7X4_9AGAR|nr:hypothetical protein BDN70DRAFT_889572 [Pholiota conissans]